LPGNAADTRFYSRYYPRRLMAEVLLDALSQVTGVPTDFKGETVRGGSAPIAYPAGWRAIQLPDVGVDSYFLKTFGRPDREKTCECERTAEPSVSQVLHMANGDTINKKLAAKEGRIAQLLAEKIPSDKIIEEAYLSSFARNPTAAEKEKVMQYFKTAEPSGTRAIIEDTYWALLSSKEFLFNH
jgi:hypothetical protein